MGISNSCLSVSLNNIYRTIHSHSSTSKLQYDIQETFDHQKNLININKASEDELLLLPGINRSLAREMINYRNIHNGFKQINDIVKVNGMTLEIFKCIYNDIIVDLPISSDKKQELINLNFASYRELCLVPGLTSALVKRIIQRRERKGPFRFIEDLLKIKGINYIILATVRPHVTVHQPKIPIATSVSEYSLNEYYSTSYRTNATDTLSLASILLETLPLELQTVLISSPPQRPLIMNEIKEKTLRFASWNLQELTKEKMQNPGVKEVICRIILENKFSLIGIQEIVSKESLEMIVQELNNPTIPSIKNWPNRSQGKWKCTISENVESMSQGLEYLGFIYDESAGVELKQTSLLSSNAHMPRSPFIALFRIYKKFELVFVNVHLQSRRLVIDSNESMKNETKALTVLAQAMKNTMDENRVIIFGSFYMKPTRSEFEDLINHHYSSMIEQNTDIDLKNLQGSDCIDNIWLSAEAKTLSTNHCGVIRQNLSSLWIPIGWSWGGLVSDHCPIWIELDCSQ